MPICAGTGTVWLYKLYCISTCVHSLCLDISWLCYTLPQIWMHPHSWVIPASTKTPTVCEPPSLKTCYIPHAPLGIQPVSACPSKSPLRQCLKLKCTAKITHSTARDGYAPFYNKNPAWQGLACKTNRQGSFQQSGWHTIESFLQGESFYSEGHQLHCMLLLAKALSIPLSTACTAGDGK